MRFQFQQALRAVILLAFVIFLFQLHNSGDLYQYINPKYEVLSQVGCFLFLILFLVQLTRIWAKKSCSCCSNGTGHTHDHGDGALGLKKVFFYIVILLPILSGTLMPEVTLNSSIAEKKGSMMSLANTALSSKENKQVDPGNANIEPEPQMPGNPANENIPLEHYEEDPNVSQNIMEKAKYDQIMSKLQSENHIQFTEQLYAPFYQEINENMRQFVGKEITLTGFIYKEKDFKPNQFVLGRFLITHCIADANLIGFLSELEHGTEPKEDTWVEAKGRIEIQEYDGVEMPALKIEEWKEIGEPKHPYVYPVSIQIH